MFTPRRYSLLKKEKTLKVRMLKSWPRRISLQVKNGNYSTLILLIQSQPKV
jgi:hypothetical protein